MAYQEIPVLGIDGIGERLGIASRGADHDCRHPGKVSRGDTAPRSKQRDNDV